ncbi:hypothetical protein CBW16_08355 [Flavobacteriaceae bacterium JJC]|nr:hypothetical protein CBW16_08355 [Flavobacteriaceae bacterium JJC]
MKKSSLAAGVKELTCCTSIRSKDRKMIANTTFFVKNLPWIANTKAKKNPKLCGLGFLSIQ